MEFIGTIKQLQIQHDRLKPGNGPNRRYDPTQLLAVEGLRLTPRGVLGLTADGSEIIDVHHADHPASRNRSNANGISLNFIANYNRMRHRFGSHIWLGCGGENILIDTTPGFEVAGPGTRLAVEDHTSGNIIYLESLMAAAPCTEFSCYVRQKTIRGEELKQTLQFLADGTRGFYASLVPDQENRIVHLGARLYIVPAS